MEANKENVFKTKIPLPIGALPALPIRLLVEKKILLKQGNAPLRIPFKTLGNQISPKAGPSASNRKPKSFKNIDTKHVTLRHRSEELDWNYNVFKDKEAGSESSSIISISDDEIYLEEEKQHFFVDQKNDLDEALSSVTPNIKDCLEPYRVRNIKRSLKRPHSRELQGLSPVANQEKFGDKVKRRLPFTEGLPDGLQSPDRWKISYMKCLDRDYIVEIIDYLLSVESKPLGVPKTSSITRACVINWLMRVNSQKTKVFNQCVPRNDLQWTLTVGLIHKPKVAQRDMERAMLGVALKDKIRQRTKVIDIALKGAEGNPSTIQTACWYLDSILGMVHIQLDKLQLTAAACYWIAQKFHGPVTPASKLVKCANKAFTADKLLSAEKAVLKKMRFSPQPVVVQDYIGYLSWYCDQNHGGEIEVAATFLYMCGLMVEKVLCEEFPSVIAVAAVKNALYLLNKKDLMYYLQKCHVFKAAEKKATNLSSTCSFLRRAVRTVSSPIYEYKTPLEHYSFQPSFIAQRIVTAVNELCIFDVRNTGERY